MGYTQLKQPSLNTVGRDGLCLDYITRFFGVPDKYASATAAWQSAQYRHPNEQPPTDVAVPVWFSYDGPYGHVAASVPGKGIYSTSAQGDKVFTSVSALVSWMGEGMTYLGWSEDINGVSVVGGDMDTNGNVTDAGAKALLTLSTLMAVDGSDPDRQPTQQEVENLIGRNLVDACNSLTSTSPWGNNWNKVKHYDEDVAAAKASAAGVTKESVEAYISAHLS